MFSPNQKEEYFVKLVKTVCFNLEVKRFIQCDLKKYSFKLFSGLSSMLPY